MTAIPDDRLAALASGLRIGSYISRTNGRIIYDDVTADAIEALQEQLEVEARAHVEYAAEAARQKNRADSLRVALKAVLTTIGGWDNKGRYYIAADDHGDLDRDAADIAFAALGEALPERP